MLMQVGQNNDWTDRGLPEVVTEFGRATKPAAAGVEWLLENHPNAEDHWRLLIWELTDKPYDRDVPDVVLMPADFLAATARRRKPVVRRRARRLALNKVTHKTPAGDELVGRTILITQDRTNCSASGAEGPWYAASAPGRDTVAVRVYEVAVLERKGALTVQLDTKVGKVGWLPIGHGVIPVEEA